MNRFDGLARWAWSVLVVCTLAFALGGCEGDDGNDGAAGAAGAAGAPGTDGTDGTDGQACWDLNGNGLADLATEDINGDGVVDVADCGAGTADAIAAAKIESCATCHDDVGTAGHQAEYNKYTDANTLAVEITSFTSVVNGADFDVTLQFDVTQDGAPYIDPVGMAPSVESQSYYIVEYDDAAGEWYNPAGGFAASLSSANASSNGDGSYTLVQTLSYDPLAFTGGALVMKLLDGELNIEDSQAGKRIHMYAETAPDSFDIGNVGNYESVANVQGCIDCHGAPYRKHGQYDATVAGVPDFTHCKACHNNSSSGGHQEWQHMVDNPLAWATGVALTPEEETLYAYDRTLVNDVHMSHAMEFPYPQSMASCTTCHEGKLVDVLDDSNFTAQTCKSCHPVRGIDAWPEDAGTTLEGAYAQPHRAPPLEYLWTVLNVQGFHDPTQDCTICHKPAVDGGVAPLFADYHNGYDATIYDAAGQRYADLNTVSIDNVSLAGNLLTINFSANNAAIVPEVLVSLYGWDSKQFIVGSHERDGNAACSGFRPGCQMEYVPESSGGSATPVWTEDSASVPGDWMVTVDFAALQLSKTDDIPTLIANGDVTMAEINIAPELDVGGTDVVLTAAEMTFDLGGSVVVADYFKGANATVDITKCNACHDALASSFHAGSGRGGDSIVVCKNCHTTTFPGSHLEMASRSIDSYVHAIHSFQPFDLGDVDVADPVEVARTEMHTGHTFPNFTIKNCEGCHVAGTFNVPDQAKSMPGVLSASDDVPDRNVGTVAETVTGPASRACGGCHRADMLAEDAAGDLASFNAHTEAFGTFVENDDEDSVVFGVIDKIMSMFE